MVIPNKRLLTPYCAAIYTFAYCAVRVMDGEQTVPLLPFQGRPGFSCLKLGLISSHPKVTRIVKIFQEAGN
jgi:hypothetical protein